jgi:hypothetical protein
LAALSAWNGNIRLMLVNLSQVSHARRRLRHWMLEKAKNFTNPDFLQKQAMQATAQVLVV